VSNGPQPKRYKHYSISLFIQRMKLDILSK